MLKGEAVPSAVEDAWAGFVAAVRAHQEQRPDDDDFHEVKTAYWRVYKARAKGKKGKSEY